MNGYKVAFKSLLSSVGIHRVLEGSGEQFVSNADAKLYKMDLGFDYTEMKAVFINGKSGFLSTITNEIINLVKTQGLEILKQFVLKIKDNLINDVKGELLKKFLDTSKSKIAPFLS